MSSERDAAPAFPIRFADILFAAGVLDPTTKAPDSSIDFRIPHGPRDQTGVELAARR
jgi:hypothetical protein